MTYFNIGTIAFIILTYLIGSIPSGVIYSQMRHQRDVRHYGSGGTGATNIGRNFGFRAAVIVAFCDALKGFIPVLLALHFFNEPAIIIATMLAAVIGHAYPIFANFKGGKIVATSMGAFLAYDYKIAILVILAFFIILYLTSIVSLSSMLSYTLIACYYVMTSPILVVRIGFILLWLFVLYRHKDNIQRLRQGQERHIRWGLRKNSK